MTDESGKLLTKAARAVEAARVLLANGDPDFAVGRAYYAMFYAAEALLIEKDLRFTKHSGVHAAYGEHFAKTGALDPMYHRWMLDAFDRRVAGEYGLEASITAEEARETIRRAAAFVDSVQSYLARGGRDQGTGRTV